jgi:transposase
MSRRVLSPVSCHAGIDVSKAELVVALLRSDGSYDQIVIANNGAGQRQLVQLLRRQGCVKVVAEATSTYSLALSCALHKAALAFSLVNPRQARAFAHSLNLRAKTDRVDARVLAQLAASLPLPLWEPPALAALQLRQISRQIQSLTAQRSAVRCRSQASTAAKQLGRAVPASLKRQATFLKGEIEQLCKQGLSLIASEAGLAQQLRLLCSVKGISAASAVTLLGELACLPRELGCRQLVAWAGLDPQPRESGPRSLPRRLSKKGSLPLRAALYMPALVAAYYEPALMRFYQRLLERGKAKMQALCAVMRKLLHAIWGMFHHQQPFDGNLLVRA